MGALDNRLRHIEGVDLAEPRSAREGHQRAVPTSQVQHSLTRLEQLECRWNPVKLEAPQAQERLAKQSAGSLTRSAFGVHMLVEPRN